MLREGAVPERCAVEGQVLGGISGLQAISSVCREASPTKIELRGHIDYMDAMGKHNLVYI